MTRTIGRKCRNSQNTEDHLLSVIQVRLENVDAVRRSLVVECG